jgi:hypothetical protein
MAFYVLLQATNRRYTTEHTNVGVAVYDDRGTLANLRVDTPDRAIRRGDLDPARGFTKDDFEAHFKAHSTTTKIKNMLGMPSMFNNDLNLTEPVWTKSADADMLDRLFNDFVLGKSLQPITKKAFAS